MQGLYALKPWYTRRLGRIVDGAVARDVSPDAFTLLGMASAVLAAVALGLGWWPLALGALAGRLAGANLDGAVARARAVSRPWGFALNEIGDRASDLVMFAGLGWLAARTAGWDSPQVTWVVLAALAATLPTFAALSAAGAGAARRNGGPLGKTERCLLAVLACAIPAWLVPICAVIVAGSVLTAVLRLRLTHRELSRP